MTNISNKCLKGVIYLSCVIVSISLLSCAKLISVKPVEEKYVPLEKMYKKIILQKFEIDQDLEREFPEAVLTCESTTMSELLKMNAAPIIQKARLSISKEANALIVKTRIITLKMASSSSRGLSGEFVGKSEMAAEVRLIDAQTRKMLSKNNLSTADIPPPSPGATLSERAIPAELGKMIAEFISRSVAGN